jgi:glucose-1-phosphate thymidylyltransferase
MKGIILAGGYARRLAPMTDFVPKPLLPLGGRPMMEWVLDALWDVGVKKFYISTNARYEDQFKLWMERFLCTRPCLGIELVIEPTTREEEKLGAIGGLRYLFRNYDIDDDVIVAGGDNYFDFSLKPLVEKFESVKKTTIALYDVGDLKKAQRFGVAVIDESGKVVEMQEKPKKPKSTLVSTAIYAFPKGIQGAIEEYLSGSNNPDAPGYFIAWLAGHHEVYGVPFTGTWADIGTLEAYREAFEGMLKSL